jgi:hypothetical protein
MMIRWGPMEVVANGFAAERHGRRSVEPAQPLRAPCAPPCLLDRTLGGGRCGALVPVLFHRGVPVEGMDVVYRLVGAFAACGLIAWRRRPDSRAGKLMTATGFGFFVAPVLTQFASPLAVTAVMLFADLWAIALVALVLTFATGGRSHPRHEQARSLAVPLAVVPVAAAG